MPPYWIAFDNQAALAGDLAGASESDLDVARAVADLPERGIRAALVAIPPDLPSPRDRIGFIPNLITIARNTGISGYVADGANHWPAVHTLDLSRLFGLAVEHAAAGAQLYAAAEDTVSNREIP